MADIKSNMDMFACRGDPWDLPPERPTPAFGMKVINFKDGRSPLVIDKTANYLRRREEFEMYQDDGGDPDMDRWTAASFVSPKRQKKKASAYIGKERPVKSIINVSAASAYARKAANYAMKKKAEKRKLSVVEVK
jgi:hypothetical protein